MINIFTQSVIGRRETNQDRYACLHMAGLNAKKEDKIYLIIVADGMGGHSCGDQYAELVIRCISARIAGILAQADMNFRWSGVSFGKSIESELQREKDYFLSKVNNDLLTEADNAEMELGGTTASICLIHENRAYFMNAGDSPIYIYNEYSEKAEEISVRDNEAEELVRTGSTKRGSNEYYMGSSSLLSYFGLREEGYSAPSKIDSHFASRKLSEGDVILIGSDGAFGREILSAESLAQFLQKLPGVRNYCKELLTKAAFSTNDNQTLAVIRYSNDIVEERTSQPSPIIPSHIPQTDSHEHNSVQQNASEKTDTTESDHITKKGWMRFGKH